MARPDPKPRKRIVNRSVALDRLHAWDAVCQLCGWPRELRWRGPHVHLQGALVLSRHHIVGKDLGGDDLDENIALLCGSGTVGCHGLVQALHREACAAFRATMTDAQLAYAIERKGADWLDRYYPLAAAA